VLDLDLDGRTVLVTGAGGFVGRQLSRVLLARGAEVHGTVRTSPAVEGVRSHAAELPADWPAIFGDVAPELVFHLAAPVVLDRSPEAWPELRRGIVDVTDEVARGCLAAGTRLVVAGTCEAYGDGPAPFSERQAPRPVSPYSAAKTAATHWVLCLARTQGLRATVVRPFLTYGPEQSPERLVPSAIDSALAGLPFEMTDGEQTREFNFVEDIAEAMARVAHPAAIGALLNLGGGPELPVLEMVQRIYRLCGADPDRIRAGALPRRPGETDRFVGDHSRARTLLGPLPTTPLETGLRLTIEARRHRAPD